jgi:hypothetical protein
MQKLIWPQREFAELQPQLLSDVIFAFGVLALPGMDLDE